VIGGHPGDQDVHHFAFPQCDVTTDRRPVDGLLQLGHRRRRQQRLFGQHIAPRGERAQRFADRRKFARLTPIGHHCRGVGALRGQFGQTDLDDTGNITGGAPGSCACSAANLCLVSRCFSRKCVRARSPHARTK